MEKEVKNKIINIDVIPTIQKNNSKLDYFEIDIDKNFQDLIFQIREALDNNDISLFEVQDSFSCVFTGIPKGYSFCFPHEYSEAFVYSADYPKIYSQEEYNSEINKIRNDYINQEKEKLIKEKEKGDIDDSIFQESLEKISKQAEERVINHIAEIRGSFVQKSIRYIQAYEFYAALKKIKDNEKNIMYSTELIGWTKFNYSINKDVNVDFKSNFCYGRSAYFHITLIYKGVEILSYPKLVQYYYANMFDIIDCTESFEPNRQNWRVALSFVVDQANWAIEDEAAFVKKWILDGTKELMQGLREILDTPNLVIDRLIRCNLDDSSLYAVRNITQDEIAEYKVYRQEMTIAFQAEKITGALLLIPNLEKISNLYPQIKTIIEDIKKINKDFFPLLDDAIHSLCNRIYLQSDQLEETRTNYETFKKLHYDEFRNYELFVKSNQAISNVYEEYLKLSPDFEITYKQRSDFETIIYKLTCEIKRLKQFKYQLSRCAQRICDYGSVIIFNDDYLTTDSFYNGIPPLREGGILISNDKRRLFKFEGGSITPTVVIPPTIRVICNLAFINNSQIEYIQFHNHLKIIGHSVFQHCYKLQEIVLPDSVEQMGEGIFFFMQIFEKSCFILFNERDSSYVFLWLLIFSPNRDTVFHKKDR